MASLCSTNFVPILFFLFLISFVIPSSIAKNYQANDFKQTICSKTINPHACLNLKHVQTSSNAKSLTKASVEAALARANDIHAKLNYLYKLEKDKHLSDIYLICSKNYNDAIRDLKLAKKSLDSSRHLRIVPIEANDAEEEVKACNTVVSGARRDPANIKKANEEVYLLSQIATESSVELVKK